MRKTTKPQLTDKQKAANDEYLANPKISKSEAIRRTYNVKNPDSAGAMVPSVFNSPAAKRYREEHAEIAANNILEMANDKTIKAETRLKANQDILDRSDGKATQKSVNQSQTVKIIADFTGGQAGARPVIEASIETPEADVSPPSADD